MFCYTNTVRSYFLFGVVNVISVLVPNGSSVLAEGTAVNLSHRPSGLFSGLRSKHLKATFDSPAQLADFAKILVADPKYSETKIAIRWVTPVEPSQEDQTALRALLPAGVYLDFVVLKNDLSESRQDQDAGTEISPGAYERAYAAWERNQQHFFGRIKNLSQRFRRGFGRYWSQPGNRVALGVGITKASVGAVIWANTGMVSEDAALLTALAVGSSAVLDVGFQALATQYAQFKRNHKIPEIKAVTTIGLKWAIDTYNSRPSLKAFNVDMIVGVGISAYFAEIAHFKDPESNQPPWSADWVGAYFLGNGPGILIGASAEMSALSLVEKEMIPRPIAEALKWTFFQVKGLSFWLKNTLIAVGVLRGVDSPVLQAWSLVEFGIYASLIAADQTLSPRSAVGREITAALPKPKNPGIHILAFDSKLNDEAIHRVRLLTGQSLATELDLPATRDPITEKVTRQGFVSWENLLSTFGVSLDQKRCLPEVFKD